MSNTKAIGSGYSVADPWKAYDALPPTAKRALQNADFNWAANFYLRRWKAGARGYKTGPDIAVRVAEHDRKQHAKDAERGRVAP